MIATSWLEIPAIYSGVNIDAYVVMPNHIHGIIRTDGRPEAVGISLPEIVQRFKSLTTRRYIDGVRQQRWRAFPSRLWQRNYYEHVIRNEHDLNAVREYILYNPARWAEDEENPQKSRRLK